jgi:2-oxo-3-hexenedioate decarboxylase
MDPQRIAAELAAAERDRRDRAPFSDEHPDLDEESAYAAQWAGIEAKLAAGHRLVGAKLGLTSKVKQRVMKVDEPLYGWVTDRMLAPYGEPVDLSRLIHPRVEPEVAFLLGRDVTAPATVTSVLAATEAVFAAVDVLDSRYENFRFTLPDVVADNASAGLFLLGPRAVRPDDLDDLRLLGCVLRVDGDVVATAAGAATMGHPAAAVAWLANRLANRLAGHAGEGRPGGARQQLRAGMLVFSGGLTEPVPLVPGVAVTAELAGLGTIEVFGR